MGINSWSVLFLEKEHMLTRLMASSFLSYFWFFMTFGRVFGIYLSARFQVSTLLTFFSVLAFGGCGIFLYAPSGIGSGIGLAMIGFFFAGTYPFLIGLGGNHHPDSVEEITTILVGASALGFMIFPWLIGLIGEIGNLKTGILLIWLLCFLLTISSGLLMYLDRKSTSS
jgi:fucose permease